MGNCILSGNFTNLGQRIFHARNNIHVSDKHVSKLIPLEQKNCMIASTLLHLGPSILFILFIQLSHFSVFSVAVFFFLVSFGNLALILWLENKFPSISLERLSMREIVEGMILVFATGIGLGTLVLISGYSMLSYLLHTPWHYSGCLAIGSALLLTDFMYYWIHRLFNHGKGKSVIIRWYRKIHARHHSLTAVDFFRGNTSTVFDTAVTGFQVPLMIISAVFGMNLESVLTTYALVLLLQSTHHANYTFNIGYLRYFFVDSHGHKLHHCPRGYAVNFAAIFSMWDILFSTYYEDWSSSSSYMAKHSIPLPIRRVYN